MDRNPNRLSAELDHRLRGSEIDRSKPLSFRLDGREIHGFAGDTLLSAAIATGLIGAGTHHGEPLALDERFAPAVLHRGGMHDRLQALPMAITPAAAGLDLVTLEHSARRGYQRWVEALRGLLPGGRRMLGTHFEAHGALPSPWFDVVAERRIEADLAVVGGGLAGLSAALTAARRGARVVLVERRQWLGGDAHFFGNTGDEPAVDETVSRLVMALRSLPNATILLHTEAFAAFEGAVRLTQVELRDGVPVSHALTLAAPRIVLANGCLERLPVFAGNRLPGVVSALAAYHRADRFGVWIGRQALLSTATSVGYRAVMQAKDAGVSVIRVADPRLNPQSRFIEFGKASGIPLARDLQPASVTPAGRKGGLTVRLEHGLEAAPRAPEQFTVDQFLVSGGWQPDLSLWHMAGGGSRWSAADHRLEAEGALNGIVLAGSVAGWRNGTACVTSGQAAVALLYGKAVAEVKDPQIDPLYETPDHPTPIGRLDPAVEGNAYLDGGVSLALRPQTRAGRSRRAWPWRRRAPWGTADQARPLGVADVAAGVQLGAIPPDDAAIVAQERCITPGDIVDAGKDAPVTTPVAAAAAAPPAYLAGRFGSRPMVWLVEATDGRAFEIGCLVHASVDSIDPLTAVGVVFAPAPTGRTGGLAVIGKASLAHGDALAVKDISAAIPVKLVDPAKPVEVPLPVPPTPAPSPPPPAAAMPAQPVVAAAPAVEPTPAPVHAAVDAAATAEAGPAAGAPSTVESRSPAPPDSEPPSPDTDIGVPAEESVGAAGGSVLEGQDAAELSEDETSHRRSAETSA